MTKWSECCPRDLKASKFKPHSNSGFSIGFEVGVCPTQVGDCDKRRGCKLQREKRPTECKVKGNKY